ncbi:adenosylcobinamide-GDP ribazoletransferase [Vibrio sp. AK197]|uniref:Adenosylcobinamide-GDP ribazoletransferase n=1 Tax=Vibrio olivae TaxID=1243002 RepID=A0ABV5HJ75_9VIBR
MLNKLRYQVELFWLALSFFSRIPTPESTPYSEERMNRAGRYFPLVGMLLGCLCTQIYHLAIQVFSPDVAIFLTMVASLLLTGAFHEDGLADMSDGIGGGMTQEKRLSIMKDSRIGTYGASALLMALLGKYVLLSDLVTLGSLLPVWIVAYTLSRAVAISLVYSMPYVSDLDASKSKPLAHRQTKTDLAVIILTGAIPCLLWDVELAATLFVVALVFRWLFQFWLTKRLGGFTGDCLGAAQQVMELLIYLTLLVVR